MKILIVISLIVGVHGWASVPTPEGLFRNGSNKDPTGSIIIFDFMIEEFEIDDENKKNQAIQAGHHRIYIEIEEKDVKSLLQVNYKGGEMKDGDALSVHHFPNFKRALTRQGSAERRLFYSLLMMMTANSSSFLSSFVKSVDPQFQLNRDLMNREKINLYTRYKNYLKKNEGYDHGSPSPLNPSNKGQRTRVNEIINAPTYLKSKHIFLVRRRSNFFWKIAMENISLFFTNEEHRFSEATYHSSSRELNVRTGPYTSLNGIHELPREMLISSLDGKKYKMRSLSLKHTNDRKKMIQWARSSLAKRTQQAGGKGIVPIVF